MSETSDTHLTLYCKTHNSNGFKYYITRIDESHGMCSPKHEKNWTKDSPQMTYSDLTYWKTWVPTRTLISGQRQRLTTGDPPCCSARGMCNDIWILHIMASQNRFSGSEFEGKTLTRCLKSYRSLRLVTQWNPCFHALPRIQVLQYSLNTNICTPPT